MNKKIFLIFGFSLIMFIPFSAQTANIGGGSSAFLFMIQNPRSTAMGYSSLSNNTGLWAFQGNPAQAGLNQNRAFSIEYSDLTLDRQLFAIGIYFPQILDFMNIQMGWNGIRVGNIDGRDELGNPTENFSIFNHVANLTFAFIPNNREKNLFSRFSLGITLKWIYSDLYRVKGQGLTGDIGLLYSVPRKDSQANPYSFQVGITVTEVFGDLRWDSGYKESFNNRMRAGVLISPFNWMNIVGDVTRWKNGLINYGTGIELIVKRLLYIRGGWNSDFGITFGVGFSLRYLSNFMLNISQLNDGIQTQTYRMWEVALGW